MCRFYIDMESLLGGDKLAEAREPPLDIDIRCCGPDTGNCTCKGRDCSLIREIRGYSYEDGMKLIESLEAKQITGRWCCFPFCGFHTRLYVTRDYDLLFIHSTNGYEGAHLVILDVVGREKVKRFLEELK